jgi:hypothetical protein
VTTQQEMKGAAEARFRELNEVRPRPIDRVEVEER